LIASTISSQDRLGDGNLDQADFVAGSTRSAGSRLGDEQGRSLGRDATIGADMIAMPFVAMILGHIYVGTLGMEGAFEAMETGEVDFNWSEGAS